jgi:long-subunit acyl-CoA synthetase (AMP-forming)
VIDLETGEKLGAGQAGELCIKSAMRMKGYVGDDAAAAALFDADGFVRTGDIGYYDPDGCIYIVDRLKELIKYNGFQVRHIVYLAHSYSGSCHLSISVVYNFQVQAMGHCDFLITREN